MIEQIAIGAVLVVCCCCIQCPSGKPLLSVAAKLLSRALFAFAEGYDMLYAMVAIALRVFLRETAAAWRNAEEVR